MADSYYDEYPRSSFPGAVDDWDNMEDVSATTLPLMEEYNALVESGNYDEAATYLNEHPELGKSLFNADKLNSVMDGVKALETFFMEDVEDYVKDLFNAVIGINDNAETEAELKANAYSAYKVLQLIAEAEKVLDVTATFTLTTGGWSGSSAPYSQTVTVSGMTSDVVFNPGIVYPDNCTRDQQKAINKAAGYIYDIETGDGSVTVKATQKPATEITLGCIGLVGVSA